MQKNKLFYLAKKCTVICLILTGGFDAFKIKISQHHPNFSLSAYISSSYGGLIAQEYTKYITNGSFIQGGEDLDHPVFNPYFMMPNDFCLTKPAAELTRCLGSWNYVLGHNDGLGGWTDVSLPYTSTVGWYQPTAGTNDYFNKIFGSWPLPNAFNGIASNTDAGIPKNRYNWVPQNTLQFPYGYSLQNQNPDEDGYTGIIMKRKYNNGNFVDWVERKNEYLQKKLLEPLINGHQYMVTFQVSKGSDVTWPEFSFRKKALKAYFSTTPITILCGENDPPLSNSEYGARIFSNLDPDNFAVIEDQNEAMELLDEDGGFNGEHWYLITLYITPDVDGLNYITIGNFTDDWASAGEIYPIPNAQNIPNPDISLDMAYYIDNVEIRDLDEEPCWCQGIEYGIFIQTFIRPQIRNGNQCCYKLYFKLINDPLTCNADWVEVFLRDDEDPNQWTLKKWRDNRLNYFTKGVEYEIDVGELCFDDSDMNEVKILKFVFHRGNQSCDVITWFTVTCPCACGTGVPPNHIELTIKESTSNESECCYVVKIKNTTDCNINLSGVSIHTDFPNSPVLMQPWNTEVLQDGYKYIPKGQYGENSSYILHADEELPIATFCIPHGTVNFPITAKYYIKDGNTEIRCDKDILEETLNCPRTDCCQYYDIYINGCSPPPPDPPQCCCCYACLWIKYNTWPIPDGCEIRRVKVYNINNPNEVYFDDQYQTNQNGAFIFELCYQWGGVTLKFEFYDQYSNFLCYKTYDLECGLFEGPQYDPKSSSFTENEVKKNVEILDFYSYPNPTDGTTNFCYELSNSANVRLVLYNSLGGNPIVIYEGEATAGLNKNTFSFESKLSGIYFIRLTAGEQTKYLPIISNK